MYFITFSDSQCECNGNAIKYYWKGLLSLLGQTDFIKSFSVWIDCFTISNGTFIVYKSFPKLC